MTTARRLLVVMYGQVIGSIDQRAPRAELAFTYDSAYADTGSTPLGVRMPVAETTYRGKVVQAFLEGVLPEDPTTRARWGSRLDVDPTDTVAILAGMGWDCPGAVQFCAPEMLDDMGARSRQLRPVTEADIAGRLRALRTQNASWTLPEEHWSLPGQQAKFALTRLPSGWHEARGSTATTHIIKPGIGRMHHQALVEHATMRAARAVGIEVASSEFLRFADDEPAIVVERYDRLVLRDGSVLRIHQEDFCSAGGRLPGRKYESNGGPGLKDLVRIVEQNASNRRAALASVGDFVAFNYVAGAPDGHSKNISLLLLPGETKVAPLYDLATSLPYEGAPMLREVAIGIGGRRKFGQVLGKHWDQAAQTLGIPAERYRQRARALADEFPDAFADALDEIGGPEAATVRTRALPAIAKHVEDLSKRLDG